MIISYTTIEQVLLACLPHYFQDIKIHSLHLLYQDKYLLLCTLDYKGMRTHLKVNFDIDIDEKIKLYDIQGVLHCHIIKMDVYTFLKDALKEVSWISFVDQQIFIDLSDLPFQLCLKEKTDKYVKLGIIS